MFTVKIGGKEYGVNPTYGTFERIFQKYDPMKMGELDAEQSRAFSIDVVWSVLSKRWYGLKPFITKQKLKDAITMPELAAISLQIPKWITGEDREAGN